MMAATSILPSKAERETSRREILMLFAGKVAERRCFSGVTPGWTRLRTRPELIAFHESAHVVIGRLFGIKAHRVTIVPQPEVKVGTGYVAGHVTLDPTYDSDPAAVARTDEAMAADRIRTMVEPCQFGDAVDELLKATEDIVLAHWNAIERFAYCLLLRQTLEGTEIERILGST